MEINDLIQKFSDSRENQQKAIFSTLFIAGNRLQTLFDHHIPDITLKQFMLLSLVRQAPEPLTFTKLGALLGCSRQNVKKLAAALEKKGFVRIRQNPADTRAGQVCPTEKVPDYFRQEVSQYQRRLGDLFQVYSQEELAIFFRLLMKLYAGIDHLEKELP